MTYPRYPAYKPSGVEWLGEVPEHWDSRRARFLLELQSRPIDDADEIVTAFRDGTVTLRKNRREEGFTNAVKEIGYQGIRKGDLVVHAMDAFAGAVGVSDSDGKGSPVYSVCIARIEGVNLNYYGLLLRNMAVSGFIASLSKGIRERSTDFRFRELADLTLPLPPVAEQEAIIAFLDRETAQIDALIAKLEQLIALLQEKRQALISHAVTMGLDPSVPMKDSGVEWLGQVPEHWEVTRLKYVATIQTGVAKGKDLSGREVVEVPYLRVANVQDGYLDLENISTIQIAATELERYLLRDGDVLMNEGGDNDKLGRGAVWHAAIDPCIHQNHVFALRPQGVSSDWLSTVAGSYYAKTFFEKSAKQTTNLASISSTNLSLLPFISPPKDEAERILSEIAENTAKLDLAANSAMLTINRLHMRRAALITAAVTGSIDVRGFKI